MQGRNGWGDHMYGGQCAYLPHLRGRAGKSRRTMGTIPDRRKAEDTKTACPDIRRAAPERLQRLQERAAGKQTAALSRHLHRSGGQAPQDSRSMLLSCGAVSASVSASGSIPLPCACTASGGGSKGQAAVGRDPLEELSAVDTRLETGGQCTAEFCSQAIGLYHEGLGSHGLHSVVLDIPNI